MNKRFYSEASIDTIGSTRIVNLRRIFKMTNQDGTKMEVQDDMEIQVEDQVQDGDPGWKSKIEIQDEY